MSPPSRLLVMTIASMTIAGWAVADRTELPAMPLPTPTDRHADGPQAAALHRFIATKKFVAEGLYPGAMDEGERLRCQALIDALAQRLLPLADGPPAKARVLAEIKSTLPGFELADTEERERAMGYIEELMAVVGVDSSGGMLNEFMYGFDPAKPAAETNAQALAAMSAAERDFAAKLDTLALDRAPAFLDATFGASTTAFQGTTIWMDDKAAPTQSVALSTNAGTATIVWLVPGRFMYTRKF